MHVYKGRISYYIPILVLSIGSAAAQVNVQIHSGSCALRVRSKKPFKPVNVLTAGIDIFIFLQSPSVRFWLEEYAFGEGETAILREQIEVLLPWGNMCMVAC